MRSARSLSYESPSQTCIRLASGFPRHVAIALTACLLALVLG